MSKDRPKGHVTRRFSCTLVLLILGCCETSESTPRFTAMSSVAGANEKYRFFVSAQRLQDGSILTSPIVVWRNEDGPSPVSLELKDGKYGIVRSTTGAVENSGAAVLMYESAGRPLRQLAPKWPTSRLDPPEALRQYIECLLAEEDKRREEASVKRGVKSTARNR